MGQDWVSSAPLLLVFSSTSSSYGTIDATLAASYAQLSATALGYGACWVGGLSSNDVKNVLGIKNIKPICVIAIGKGEPDNKSNRKPQESIVDFL